VKILVTGGAGYLGSVLVPKLLVRGHQVRVVDIGYFGMGHLRGMRPEPELVREDLRAVISDPAAAARTVDGFDCVIHLAALSNDPSADLQPELTEQTNLNATVALAQAARDRGIRFIFSSTCSVYGEGAGELDEDGPTNPLTVYAVSKLRAERQLEAMSSANWRPVILRNGTLFGYSPRMRFDLVVNIFAMTGALYHVIRVFGEGRQWRPFLHVADCARALVHFAERSGWRHIRYNVSHENLRVMDLAQIFQQIQPGLQVNHVPVANVDSRDYSVTARRLREEGFETRSGVRAGAEEIMEAIVSGVLSDPESVFYQNAKWLKELTNIGSSDHRHIVDLMETFNDLRRRPRG
jgi:nucleoside-diphosphate-sugar epimerase